jgi:hypothetical protein
MMSKKGTKSYAVWIVLLAAIMGMSFAVLVAAPHAASSASSPLSTAAGCSYPTISHEHDAETVAGTTAQTLTLTTVTGDSILVAATSWSNTHPTHITVQDNKGDIFVANTFVAHTGTGGGSSNESIWTVSSAAASATTTIYVNRSTGGGTMATIAWDINGAAATTVGTAIETATSSLALSVVGGGCDLLIAPNAVYASALSGCTNTSYPVGWTAEVVGSVPCTLAYAWYGAGDNSVGPGGTDDATITSPVGAGISTSGAIVAFGNTTGTIPGAPTALTATTTSTSAIHLAWTQASGGGITDNTVYEYAGACDGTLTVHSIGSAAVAYSATGLAHGVTYCFAVTSTNATGEGPQSAFVLNTTVPDAPSALIAATASAYEIDLSWTNPASENLSDNSVSLYSGLLCGGTATTFDLGSAGTSFASTFLSPQSPYSYTVTASTSGGSGAASACAFNMTGVSSGGGGGGGGGGGCGTSGQPACPTSTTANKTNSSYPYAWPPMFAAPAFNPVGLAIQNGLGVVSLVGGAILLLMRRFILGPLGILIGLALLFLVI